ncbi:type I restriction-modification system, DNA-methyltransferase subunit M [Aquipluma nitroreducens]|uniref:site-specific DNA-methyltransferase (adenine-specific) n=1 Tax=Aquipluma nitroreducens TaxID=2010828 RepID=A0A5K7S419_9BACT|nr:N-6 DNA methylase [Aquipluma nitroreducens]BBE16293.1 type I restriction-modification system, DNA-methyltransferase subunit M [Aquipluma nitroreducens]
MTTKKISLSKLNTFLKLQCDNLRAAGLDASEYKDYIIAMLFLKRVNDQFEIGRIQRTSNLLKEYPDLSQEEIEEELEEVKAPEYEFFVPKKARWKIDYQPTPEEKQTELRREEIRIELQSDKLSKEEKLALANELIGLPLTAAWYGISTVLENVGDALSIALNALEDANAEILQGILSTTKFNAVNTKGEKVLSDEVLSQMLKDFNRMKLTDDQFEFPDLLGAAYEFLIKYFAESAGKKGGEFYTPSPVVHLMGKILQPAIDAEICDPTIGSGGLAINMRNYVEARYGTAKHLTIHGQELKDGIYKMCVMNMIFHNIRNANIQQGDTILDPKLVENGQLRKYDIVVANPPFSQNYTTAGMRFKERFVNWMSQKKQADFMFVQHMIATLKDNGRMAVVMPHGVLFRGGEEQRMRKRLIEQGILECIIGLPPALFFGTGIPASILIVNKAGAAERDGVFFINADREYREGKNQNTLRPEDIEKISYVYTHKKPLPKYSRLVKKAELEAEEFNCNIRRYVDNAPEPTPNDVHAHLKGGLPDSEITALDNAFACYNGLKVQLFDPLKEGYQQFSAAIAAKEDIKTIIYGSEGYAQAQKRYADAMHDFWQTILPLVENLPVDKDVYHFVQGLTEAFALKTAAIEDPLLDEFQSRGAFAQYVDELETDFKSVAASEWNAELIPEEDILESQFPELLAESRAKQARKEELEALFAEVAELEETEWNETDYEVIPKGRITEIKATIKQLNGQRKELENDVKILEKRISAYRKDGNTASITKLQQEIKLVQLQIVPLTQAIETAEAGIQRHVDLENEVKACASLIRAIEQRKEELVEQAREQITPEVAKQLIMNRWQSKLHSTINSYLEVHTRQLQQAVEELHDKYTVTLTDILTERETFTSELNKFLEELGYE